jgi:hypothetical protein
VASMTEPVTNIFGRLTPPEYDVAAMMRAITEQQARDIEARQREVAATFNEAAEEADDA